MNTSTEVTPLKHPPTKVIIDNEKCCSTSLLFRRRYGFGFVVALLLFLLMAAFKYQRFQQKQQQQQHAQISSTATAKEVVEEVKDWFPNIGNYSMPITTYYSDRDDDGPTVEKIQRLFDIGLMECFGFAFTEAQQTAMKIIKEIQGSTQKTTQHHCPMCYWLLAMSYSPFINHPFPSESSFEKAASAANQAIKSATEMKQHLTVKEKGLIDAMAVRFQSFENQTIGFQAYREKMEDLNQQIPNDLDVVAFLADSIMILNSDSDGYHFYPITSDISHATNLLEECLMADYHHHHPLCEHLYIHITEPSTTPDRAEDAADKLSSDFASTEAQHLQHMPSHTYLRIGRYHDAALANIKAHKSDEAYLRHNQLPYGPAHDTAFLIHAAQMSGERRMAYHYADILRRHYMDYPDQPDYPGAELGWHIWRTVRLRFGDWQPVLDDSDDTPRSWPYAEILGHFSKGIALLMDNQATSNSIHAATKCLQSLQTALPTVDEPFEGVATIANLTLSSAIEFWKGNMELSMTYLQAARLEQDSWAYTEPPAWFMTVAQCEGTLLRILGHPDASVRVFQQDLTNIPESRHGLYGLWKAMIDAGADESSTSSVKRRFDAASSWADDPSDNSPFIVCPLLGE